MRTLAAVTWALLAVASLAGIAACGGPPLEPWHTVRLGEEFTAARGDEIRTLDDYRRLEDALFAEVREKVVAPTPTGPAYELFRFSAGSAADPERRQPDWNRTFELTLDAPAGGVLLLHGMSDAPYSLRALGEILHRRGFWVVGLRLPGHGTAPSGLKHIRQEDLTAAVRLAMTDLAAKVNDRPIHIVGYSTGGPLAVEFALDALDGHARPRPASLILVSPAIGVHPAVALAKWKNRLALLPGLERLAWAQILPEFDPYKYNSFATNAGDVVHRLARSTARRIRAGAEAGTLTAFPPTLVFLSTVDATVSANAVVDRLLARLPPGGHELVLFDINRFAVKSKLLIADPAPMTDRLMGDATLPFAVTLITNETEKTTRVQAHRKPPFSGRTVAAEPLDLAWPIDVVSLSHVALPIPSDDPLYGVRPPDNEDALFLGQMAIQGERGLLRLSGDWLLRLRNNPLYPVLESRVLAWVGRSGADPLARRDRAGE